MGIVFGAVCSALQHSTYKYNNRHIQYIIITNTVAKRVIDESGLAITTTAEYCTHGHIHLKMVFSQLCLWGDLKGGVQSPDSHGKETVECVVLAPSLWKELG